MDVLDGRALAWEMRNEGAAFCTHKTRGWEFFFELASERARKEQALDILSLVSHVHLLLLSGDRSSGSQDDDTSQRSRRLCTYAYADIPWLIYLMLLALATV